MQSDLKQIRMGLTKEQLDWINKMSGKRTGGGKKVKNGNAEAWADEEMEFTCRPSMGLDDVAGMDELKETIKESFINVIRHANVAKQFGIRPPAMLLYGPSGCGKTYFAEKMAEELDINFMKVCPEELASTLIHGTQQKIGEVFNRAERNAPTLLFFDEFDCMVPQRGDGEASKHTNAEVNEFLCKLDKAAEREVYVVAATNYPELIDRAVLRTGRIDEIIYVDMPDRKSRESLLKLELQRLPVESDIDYGRLADKAQGLNCSDISYVVKKAAREMFNRTIRNKGGVMQRISTAFLERLLDERMPSVNENDLRRYKQVREKFASGKNGQKVNKIGFR